MMSILHLPVDHELLHTALTTIADMRPRPAADANFSARSLLLKKEMLREFAPSFRRDVPARHATRPDAMYFRLLQQSHTPYALLLVHLETGRDQTN